jgi:DNA-directed RNA polymerase specialized sigma24 family protein
MQPRTEPLPTCGDEADLYHSLHRDLERTVARRVRASHELIEDACQFAWLKLIDNQPRRESIFGWLYVVALHEAYRLSAIERRDAHLERLNIDEHDWQELIPDPRILDGPHEALEALRAVAALPERQRIDFALKVAGYSYEEIRSRTPGRTATNVSKSLVKARARLRQAAR